MELKTGNFVVILTKRGSLWLGMTGGLLTQVDQRQSGERTEISPRKSWN